MPTLLQINSSPLDSSISRELTAAYVESWKSANPTGTVTSRNLLDEEIKPISQPWVFAAYSPEENLTPEQKQLLAQSERYIAELQAADELVIGAGMHNFGVPASLKLWIDQISRRGKTFAYDSNGARGLLKVKKATILISTGGVYSADSPAAAMDFVEPYLRAVFGFLGIKDIRVVTASGAAQVMTGAVERDVFIKPVVEKVKALAA
ncbi:MAG TPA: NAD(P)H-dependent oxidoreductase [Edaphobacter sp.]|jgi:FMN-dependent NADH-azoreductase